MIMKLLLKSIGTVILLFIGFAIGIMLLNEYEEELMSIDRWYRYFILFIALVMGCYYDLKAKQLKK